MEVERETGRRKEGEEGSGGKKREEGEPVPTEMRTGHTAFFKNWVRRQNQAVLSWNW